MIAEMSARALIALALTVLLDVFPGGSTASAEEPKSKAPAPRDVRVTPAAERTLARTVAATGTLAADDQVVLGTKVAGRLAEVNVDLGSPGKRGHGGGPLRQSGLQLPGGPAGGAPPRARGGPGLRPRAPP